MSRGWGRAVARDQCLLPPPSIAGKLWGLKHPFGQVWSPDRVAKGRVGNGLQEGLGSMGLAKEAMGIRVVPVGLCTGQLPRPLCCS